MGLVKEKSTNTHQIHEHEQLWKNSVERILEPLSGHETLQYTRTQLWMDANASSMKDVLKLKNET